MQSVYVAKPVYDYHYEMYLLSKFVRLIRIVQRIADAYCVAIFKNHYVNVKIVIKRL